MMFLSILKFSGKAEEKIFSFHSIMINQLEPGRSIMILLLNKEVVKKGGGGGGGIFYITIIYNTTLLTVNYAAKSGGSG